MRTHIHAVVGRYKGRVHGWDVVNEAFDDAGNLHPSPWRDGVGGDFIELGAVLLGWSRWRDQTKTIAYRNPDGTLVGVAGNWSERTRRMSVRLGSKWLNFEMEPHSFETCVVSK